jgi:tRNA A37 methylthiotransferase MiaB
MRNQVPVQVARDRNKVLRDLAEEKKQRFMRSFVGEKLEAITLGSCGAGAFAREASDTALSDQESSQTEFTEALTDNYLKLRLRGSHSPNQWLTVKIEGVKDSALMGRV